MKKPMKDLCRISQQKSGAIKHSENRPEEKSTVSIYASVVMYAQVGIN